MILAVTILSIMAIAGAAWRTHRLFGTRVCPICAGVAGTWIWLFAARQLGYPIDPLITALLMGGSIVGIAYSAEKYLLPRRSALSWKMLFVPTGFVAGYGILMEKWVVALAALVGIAVVLFLFLRFSSSTASASESARIEKLKRDMEKCC